MSESILIKGGTIVTMDDRNSIVQGDVLIRDGRIAEIASAIDADASDPIDTIDARGCAVLPGFVQTHIHLCQTLFRGAADDLSLIDWLKKRIWPMEAAHTKDSVRASARLGIAEMIRGGSTCALTMETVRHTEEVLRVVEETGFRATVGKCMMDQGDGVPSELHEDTDQSIRESVDLIKEWHGRAGGRVRCCFAPRFAISCTRELLSEVSELARQHQVMIHTHASENRKECEIVEAETGRRNVAYLDSLGISGAHVVLAHCVHLDTEEMEILTRSRTNVAHCPSSNLKLGSGLARVAEMLSRGIPVSLGADGAACNNRLDMFTEMRTAALLQKLAHGPEVLPAARVLRLATIDGARALGLEKEIGSLEAGKRADVIVVKLDPLHSTPQRDVVSALVYSAVASDVGTTIIDGQVLMRNRELLTLNEASVIEEANREASALAERAGISV
ncbi:MAG: 5-methylthioadenosine/S-adenosylhomocysteine deaminase [Blastocatellia bacterium]|jgi:5-methylthioadenosine/S-adenosylhomocysteine deaminase|nr:5-methylthioadenosine/S-adenosylhomocysteine deaminase [Blastocatellia bacterium]